MDSKRIASKAGAFGGDVGSQMLELRPGRTFLNVAIRLAGNVNIDPRASFQVISYRNEVSKLDLSPSSSSFHFPSSLLIT